MVGHFSVVPLAFIYAVSTFSPKSIWNERHLIITVAPFLLLVVVSLNKLHPRWLKTSALILVVAWSAAGGFGQVTQDDELTRIPLQSMVLQMTMLNPPMPRVLRSMNLKGTSTGRLSSIWTSLMKTGSNRFLLMT